MKSFLASILGCLPLLAAAQIYRWVDPNGQVHFSQNPPASGHYEEVTPPPSYNTPSANVSAGVKPAFSSHTDGNPNLKVKADNAERCAKARERVSFLEQKTASRLFKTGDDGQPSPLTQDEFDQQLNDAKAAGSKYCN